MDRIKRATPATISNSWYTDGTLVDPGTVTVGITGADGTVVVPAGTAVSGGGAAARTFNLTTTHTAVLDILTATWTSSTQGLDTTTHEIVGDFLFNIADARALQPLNNATTYTTAAISDMRTTVEESIEEEYGAALVPRYTRATLSGDGTMTLRLRDPVRTIRSITVGGTALSSTELAALTFDYGFVTGYRWTAGTGNIVVGYEHGLDSPPRRIKLGGLALARQWLVKGPIDDRALGVAAPDGAFSFGLATPGRNGSIFGLPDLDAAITASPYRTGVA